jgi:hypothetical protein
VPNETWVLLDAVRRKRNTTDYTGEAVQPEMVAEATAQAAALLKSPNPPQPAARRPPGA